MSGQVQVFKCPEVAFHSGVKKDRESSFKKGPPKPVNGLLSKKEVSDFMVNVRNFSKATTATGMEKLHHKQDILTKLGVPAPKEQTMPFKMKMGILKGRQQRLEKIEAEQKQSGSISSMPYLLQQQRNEQKLEKAAKGKAKDHNSLHQPDIMRNFGQKGAHQHTRNMSNADRDRKRQRAESQANKPKFKPGDRKRKKK
jgi:hypothetical protein